MTKGYRQKTSLVLSLSLAMFQFDKFYSQYKGSTFENTKGSADFVEELSYKGEAKHTSGMGEGDGTV